MPSILSASGGIYGSTGVALFDVVIVMSSCWDVCNYSIFTEFVLFIVMSISFIPIRSVLGWLRIDTPIHPVLFSGCILSRSQDKDLWLMKFAEANPEIGDSKDW